MVRSNSVLTATRLFEFVISEKLALSRALKPYLTRGPSGNASTFSNSGARVCDIVSVTSCGGVPAMATVLV
ncbi:hypothetical protein Tco_1102413, partial [Tanacetum coccineum]